MKNNRNRERKSAFSIFKIKNPPQGGYLSFLARDYQ